jgi:RNA polymerase sigma-70 factor (ECF subfamily)
MTENTTDEPTDFTLLQAWRNGDADAGNALVQRHFVSLQRFLRHKAGAEADELFQRTLLACVESHRRIRGDSSFRTYLFTIARHELYRFYKRRDARRRWIDVDACVLRALEPSALDLQIHRQSRRELSSALLKLPERDRRLLALVYVDELDSSTLAAALGIKPTSVRARLHRARRELRSALLAEPLGR